MKKTVILMCLLFGIVGTNFSNNPSEAWMSVTYDHNGNGLVLKAFFPAPSWGTSDDLPLTAEIEIYDMEDSNLYYQTFSTGVITSLTDSFSRQYGPTITDMERVVTIVPPLGRSYVFKLIFFAVGSQKNYSIANLDTVLIDVNTSSSVLNTVNNFNSLMLYPNPTQNTITITGITETHTVSLYDTGGREVFRGMRPGNDSEPMRFDLPTGMYAYQIQTESGNSKMGKLAVQR
jgi:hypothetical protein